jgi:hypothetical protein
MRKRALRIRITFVSAILVSLATLTPSSAAVGTFDGSKNLMCATLQIFECDFSAECVRKTNVQADFPVFVDVEFDAKRLVAVVGEGEGRSTAIESVRTKDGKTIVQGAENGRAWNIVIEQASGDMTSTVADIGATFSIFGACTPK